MYTEKSTQSIATAAMLVAVSIVLGKYLAITVGPLRLSLENLPVLLAGVLLGPVTGCAVGIVADLVGCVLVGYTINPIVTLGAGVIGLTAGIFYRAKWPEWWPYYDYSGRLLIAIIVAHFTGSCLIKSLGLYLYYDYPVSILLLRLPLYAAIGLCEFLILRPVVPLLRKKFFSKGSSS